MYGLGDEYVDSATNITLRWKNGFAGNYRQFFITLGYVLPETVPMLKH